MQVNANDHVQRSATEWQGIITRYRQSRRGMQEFCTQVGLTLRTFEEWRRRQHWAERSKGPHRKMEDPLSLLPQRLSGFAPLPHPSRKRQGVRQSSEEFSAGNFVASQTLQVRISDLTINHGKVP